MGDEQFSLMRGGPVYRLFRRLGLRGRRVDAWVAITLVLVTMAPLLALTATAGTLVPGFSTVRMPLLGDYAVLARFLVALPLLVLSARICDVLLGQALAQLSRSGIVHPVQRVPFDTVLARMKRLRDSSLPELICLLVALAPVLLGTSSLGGLTGISDWRHSGEAASPAAVWFTFGATSIFRFVALIWLWRFMLWAWLLWRFSRLDMDIRAGHPDRAGGLAFLGVIQQRFSVLAVAAGALVSGRCMNHVAYLGDTLHDMRYLLLGFILAATVFIAAPLMVMIPLTLRAKRHGILSYSLLGHAAATEFERRWLVDRAPDAQSLLDVADASALCDFTSVHDTAQGMSVIPISRGNLFWIAGAAALPMIPLVFLALPVDAVLQKLGSIIM